MQCTESCCQFKILENLGEAIEVVWLSFIGLYYTVSTVIEFSLWWVKNTLDLWPKCQQAHKILIYFIHRHNEWSYKVGFVGTMREWLDLLFFLRMGEQIKMTSDTTAPLQSVKFWLYSSSRLLNNKLIFI